MKAEGIRKRSLELVSGVDDGRVFSAGFLLRKYVGKKAKISCELLNRVSRRENLIQAQVCSLLSVFLLCGKKLDLEAKLFKLSQRVVLPAFFVQRLQVVCPQILIGAMIAEEDIADRQNAVSDCHHGFWLADAPG